MVVGCYGVDLGARDAATVGGTVATNAGGIHVLRYGSTRRQLVGIEAVLADGRVIRRLDGLEKDNTGYDLAGLVCGSEGTLAVVTAARLRLHPRPSHTVAALCAFAAVDGALDGDRHAATRARARERDRAVLRQRSRARVRAARAGPAVPAATRRLRARRGGGAYRSDRRPSPARSKRAPTLPTSPSRPSRPRSARCGDTAKASPKPSTSSARPHKLDVALPASTLGAFVHEVAARVVDVAPAAAVWLFGHAADGNVHVNVTGVEPDDERVTDAVLGLVAELHGSISAEHGIGTAKRRWLHLVRTPAEIATYRAIKRALDPVGILNPHVLLLAPGPSSDSPGVASD